MRIFNEKQKQLIDALKGIGYDYRYCGCDIYQIVNDKKRGTEFLFDSEKVYLDDSGTVFNIDRRSKRYGNLGAVNFYFNKCKITFYKKENFVSISAKGAFINFRPHKK